MCHTIYKVKITIVVFDAKKRIHMRDTPLISYLCFFCESKIKVKDFKFIEYNVSIVLIITTTSHELYGLDFA